MVDLAKTIGGEVMAAKTKAINRIKATYPPGTEVYCWKFFHPVAGWCGGGPKDDWSTNRGEIESRMQHCQWISKLIVEVVS